MKDIILIFNITSFLNIIYTGRIKILFSYIYLKYKKNHNFNNIEYNIKK